MCVAVMVVVVTDIMRQSEEIMKRHYAVQINHPVRGISVIGVYSDLDDAWEVARQLDWAQVVIYIDGEDYEAR